MADVNQELMELVTELRATNDAMEEEITKYGEALGETQAKLEELQNRIDQVEAEQDEEKAASKRLPVDFMQTKDMRRPDPKAKAFMEAYIRKGYIGPDEQKGFVKKNV